MKEIKNISDFFQIQKKFPNIPFSQSEAWFNYLKDEKASFSFFVDDEIDTKIACWGKEYKAPFIGGKILRIDGESYKPEVNEKIIKLFYKELCELNYKGIEINSNNPYNIDFEIGIRRAGFQRPLAMTASPLTIEINLSEDFNFDRNWKRNVKKAEQSDLVFSELTEIQSESISQIVRMFGEMADLKHLGYRLEANSLKRLLQSYGIRTFIVHDKNQNPIAARIIHEHNAYLTDVFAANSLEARNCGATHFIMNEIFNLLKHENKTVFDFGRIPPSNHASDSVYVFKNASRGRKIQYNGEWVYYKSKWLEYLMLTYKQLLLKKQRY